ncbi:fumarylacetoacetate hydrolase family protein [Francisella sp. 19X1-34]|uniref:fumarylacetoacetate hydrolase family protein n=1 Tax=Francisella sp. 19X1-34 TaxID=3087177 RepID=UPI002E335DB8|nr:fumarylacetoacetate hydrolase family protein [Francisella sp. 19X1-34]MED7789563.1 fumarylacetoacetate hydrolase family protein [Francisella sp. 19X1-34]
MKFLRYKHEGYIYPCILLNNTLYNLRDHIDDICPKNINKLVAIINDIDLDLLPVLTDNIQKQNIQNCIYNPGKIIAIGMNYLDHLERVDFLGGPKVKPENFIFFQKPSSSITGPYDPIYIPKIGGKLDYENELAVIIGKTAKNIQENHANEYIFGYCIGNDVSDRSLQFQKPGQFNMGKSCDSFCPLGPYLVTKDEINPSDLFIRTKVNNQFVQDGSTQTMIFNIPYLISKLSEYFTLEPGDIILTGTPQGVQLENEILGEETHYLKENDRLELEIEGLGKQENLILKA